MSSHGALEWARRALSSSERRFPARAGMKKMNIRLSPPRMRALFNSLDADGTGEIDLAEFTAGVLGQRVGENLSVEMRPH
jgi:hypothetical protein